jgi:hypothetical protein
MSASFAPLMGSMKVGMGFSHQRSALQLLQSEVAVVTLLAGLLLAVYLALNR